MEKLPKDRKEASAQPEDEFTSEKRFMLETLDGRDKGNPDALRYQPAEFRDDKEIAHKAI